MTKSHPIALVTGAGRSIGRAVAERLHKDGFKVAVTDIDADVARETAASLSADGMTARAWSLDVSSVQDIQRVFDEVEGTWGSVTALVNNAGVYPNHPSLLMSESDWDRVLDINLKGTFFCCQAFAQRLNGSALSGTIVNLASTAAFSARPGAAHYGASKAAIVMLTKSLAQEWGELGIRVNAVAPGLIEVREGLVSPEYKAEFISQVPARRIGDVRDVADAVAYLIGDESSYVTGHCLVVDGGFLAGRALRPSGKK